MPAPDLSFLPHVNASLNATSFVLICAGLVAIKRRRENVHKNLMLSATAVSALFLVCYLVYHYLHGSTKFTGQGTIRLVYFAILLSHTVLAVVVAPLVILTVRAGLREDRERRSGVVPAARRWPHRRLAVITAPIWLYVSVTGVAVYWMLYRM